MIMKISRNIKFYNSYLLRFYCNFMCNWIFCFSLWLEILALVQMCKESVLSIM